MLENMIQATSAISSLKLTVAQSTVVPSAPRVEFTVSGDRSAVGAPTSNVYHMLSCLFPIEGCDYSRLF